MRVFIAVVVASSPLAATAGPLPPIVQQSPQVQGAGSSASGGADVRHGYGAGGGTTGAGFSWTHAGGQDLGRALRQSERPVHEHRQPIFRPSGDLGVYGRTQARTRSRTRDGNRHPAAAALCRHIDCPRAKRVCDGNGHGATRHDSALVSRRLLSRSGTSAGPGAVLG